MLHIGLQRGRYWPSPLFFCCALAVAQTDDVQFLRQSVLAADWAQADAAIARLQSSPAIDPTELLFLTGMTAMARQHYPRAIEAFRKILQYKPDLVRVRLELGRALFLNGDYEAAQFHFERALAADIPLAVADNIRHYLSQIRAKRQWAFDLSLSLLSDSNASNGSSRDYVELGGLEFKLNDDAKSKSGNGWQLSAYGQAWMPLSDDMHRLKAWSSLSHRDYGNDAFDDTQLRIGAGPQWLSSRSDMAITPFVAIREYGHKPYSRSYGLRAEYLTQIGTRWLAIANAEWQHQDNQIDDARSGPLGAGEVKVVHTLSATASLAVGLDHLREKAQRERLAQYQQTGASVAIHHDWRYGITYHLAYHVAQISYDEPHAFFGEKRRDTRNTASISLGLRALNWFGFMPMLSVSHIVNKSNIDFFEYDRTVVQIAGTRRF